MQKIHLRAYPSVEVAQLAIQQYSKMNPHAIWNKADFTLKFPNGEVFLFLPPTLETEDGKLIHDFCGRIFYSVWICPGCANDTWFRAMARVRFSSDTYY